LDPSPHLYPERRTMMNQNYQIPIWKKYSLTVEEAAAYFHIGENKIRKIIGDNQDVIEEGVRKDQIFAYVFKVKRKGKIIEPGSFWWDFFAGPWMEMIPARRTVSRLYGTITKKKREKNS